MFRSKRSSIGSHDLGHMIVRDWCDSAFLAAFCCVRDYEPCNWANLFLRPSTSEDSASCADIAFWTSVKSFGCSWLRLNMIILKVKWGQIRSNGEISFSPLKTNHTVFSTFFLRFLNVSILVEILVFSDGENGMVFRWRKWDFPGQMRSAEVKWVKSIDRKVMQRKYFI